MKFHRANFRTSFQLEDQLPIIIIILCVHNTAKIPKIKANKCSISGLNYNKTSFPVGKFCIGHISKADVVLLCPSCLVGVLHLTLNLNILLFYRISHVSFHVALLDIQEHRARTFRSIDALQMIMIYRFDNNITIYCFDRYEMYENLINFSEFFEEFLKKNLPASKLKISEISFLKMQ